MVRGHVDAAEIGKRGACHLFRHTMATLMLGGGADIRFIQAMLGLADLKTSRFTRGHPAAAGDPPRHASGEAGR